MKHGNIFVNFLTILALLATFASCALTVAIAAFPDLPVNPFPPTPITLQPIAVLSTLTPTAAISATPPIAPSATASATATATSLSEVIETLIPTPDFSQTPTATQFTDTPEPTHTSAPTFTATKTRSAFPFTLQEGGPTPTKNFANAAGCNWMGIAGQAFDPNGDPIRGNLIFHLEGGGLDADALPGSAPAYGPGGYEFFLNNHPVQTTGEYQVQLRDNNGAPLSAVILVDTFADCQKNLILVNFVQNH